jgi:hypothetical protein
MITTMMKKILGRKDILEAKDREKFEEVEVPEWGGIVLVRVIGGDERDRFEASIMKRRGDDVQLNMENIRARLVALSVVDENGERLFSDADVIELGKKSGVALDRVYEIAQRINGLTKKDVKELAKNSELDQDGGSSSV